MDMYPMSDGRVLMWMPGRQHFTSHVSVQAKTSVLVYQLYTNRSNLAYRTHESEQQAVCRPTCPPKLIPLHVNNDVVNDLAGLLHLARQCAFSNVIHAGKPQPGTDSDDKIDFFSWRPIFRSIVESSTLPRIPTLASVLLSVVGSLCERHLFRRDTHIPEFFEMPSRSHRALLGKGVGGINMRLRSLVYGQSAFSSLVVRDECRLFFWPC
ncbi:hypothetical protein BJV74DRAFT_553206 [Russula compacta]|nr:hypothetical protein BJV74DRAFT_553206 [Russula compacta]